MNGIFLATLAVFGVGLLLLPRRLAPLPFLMGCCYLPFSPTLDLGPAHFTAVRILVAVGMLRLTVRGEWWLGKANSIDRWMLLWAGWMVAVSPFHEDLSGALVFRLGLLYDACGLYLLMRSFCRSLEDIVRVSEVIAVVLTPLALGLLYEKVTVHDVFSVFGGVGDSPMMREGHVRATGPFGHPILAGTVGGVCFPLMLGLRKINRSRAALGALACLVIIVSSASSGPILSAIAGSFGVFMYRYRDRVKLFQRGAIAMYLLLEVVMKDPPYFLIARIDLAGGSTSWYRARLIQSAFEHLSEWWLVGTDYTRHWMWVLVSWSPNHTDITSHYIQMGVYGGLPLMFLFIIVLMKAFGGVTDTLQRMAEASPELRFMFWSVGACLFAHAATMFSVSYFDQSFIYLYVPLAVIGSAWSAALSVATVPAGAPVAVRVQASKTAAAPARARQPHGPVTPPGRGDKFGPRVRPADLGRPGRFSPAGGRSS